MKKISCLVFNNLKSIYSRRRIVFILLIYIYINYVTNKIYDIKTIKDIIIFSFYGTSYINNSMPELLKWSLVQITLMYLILDFINNEISNRKLFTILRIGDKKMWVKSIIISILVSCFIYFLIGLFILIILNFYLVKLGIDFIAVLKIINLLSLSTFSICLIGFIFIIFIKNQALIMCILTFLYYICIGLGNINMNLDKWLLFNQGVLAKHYYSALSYQWSYCYIGIACIILYYAIVEIILSD